MDKHAYIDYLHQAIASQETALANSADRGDYPGSDAVVHALRRQLSATSKELEEVLTEPDLADYGERVEGLTKRLQDIANE